MESRTPFAASLNELDGPWKGFKGLRAEMQERRCPDPFKCLKELESLKWLHMAPNGFISARCYGRERSMHSGARRACVPRAISSASRRPR
eukprot:4044862-Pleurochrysis_carterae.AAC.1